MEIIDRKTARNNGMTQYYTGIPCINGHTTYRYVQSGTCSACIRANNGQSASESRQDRSWLNDLVSIRVRLWTEDIALFRSMALAALLARQPTAQIRDIWKTQPGTRHDSGSALYDFRCTSEDLEPLKALAVQLYHSTLAKLRSKSDINADRERILRNIQRQAGDGRDESWPKGDPR